MLAFKPPKRFFYNPYVLAQGYPTSKAQSAGIRAYLHISGLNICLYIADLHLLLKYIFYNGVETAVYKGFTRFFALERLNFI